MLGTDNLISKPINTENYIYYIKVFYYGRIEIIIYDVNKDEYSRIYGDKKKQHDSYQLLEQITSVVMSNKENNAAIEAIINKYWKPIRKK